MKVRDVLNVLNEWAPLHYAEDFDNTGLLVGDSEQQVTGILVSLDATEEVITEALNKSCNVVVSFHPIIFKGLKKLDNSGYVERAVHSAIRNDIAIIAIHTALDNAPTGVNYGICKKLELQHTAVLIPKVQSIKKLTTYVPASHADTVRQQLFEAGGGAIGNYDHCSFNVSGTGTFRGNSESNPTIGTPGEDVQQEEIKLTMTYQSHVESRLLQALFRAHPYEEVAYEIITLNNSNQDLGMGMTGDLPEPMDEQMFLDHLKTKMNCSVIRHSALRSKPIRKVAVLGGSGSFAIGAAIRAKADAFVTADLKYHDFFQADSKIVLCDIGHYESEQFTKSLIVSVLSKKIPNFAIILSETKTNPVKYY